MPIAKLKKKIIKPKLPLYDERILSIMDYIIKENIDGINSAAKFLKSIGFENTNNVSKVRNGSQSFGKPHIQGVIDVYGVDANFLFARSHTQMFLKSTSKTAYMRLREVVHEMGLEIGK